MRVDLYHTPGADLGRRVQPLVLIRVGLYRTLCADLGRLVPDARCESGQTCTLIWVDLYADLGRVVRDRLRRVCRWRRCSPKRVLNSLDSARSR
eukprot:3066063-Rhodomonas_salina.9